MKKINTSDAWMTGHNKNGKVYIHFERGSGDNAEEGFSDYLDCTLFNSKPDNSEVYGDGDDSTFVYLVNPLESYSISELVEIIAHEFDLFGPYHVGNDRQAL